MKMKTVKYPCSNCVKLYNEDREESIPEIERKETVHDILSEMSDNWMKLECTECGQVRFVKNLEENYTITGENSSPKIGV